MSSKKDTSDKDEETGDVEIVDETEYQDADGSGEQSVQQAADQAVSGQPLAQIAELKKQNLYLLADFDNYRKQAIRERSDLIKFGNEPIVREFLGVLDNLELACATGLTPETMETYKSGVEMILTQFKKVLERFGVEEIDPKGQVFDPNLHEALGSDNNADLPPNIVTQVLKKAYKLRGKVIRPAQVLVNTIP